MAQLKAKIMLERIDRIMDKHLFRFHTAHVRNVSNTVRHQLIRFETNSVC